jgi:hypothetical protein
MGNHEIFEAVLSLATLILTGFGVVLWTLLRDAKRDAAAARAAAQKAEDDVKAHELYCARTYVTQEGLTLAVNNLEKSISSLVQAVKDNMDETRQNFRDVFSKINAKQDK